MLTSWRHWHAGKTSVLRTLAGLWQSGSGSIYSYGLAGLGDPGVVTGGSGGVLFLPQKPYMVLGSLRDQLLYPTWTRRGLEADGSNGSSSSNGSSESSSNGSESATSSIEELRKATATPAKEVCVFTAQPLRNFPHSPSMTTRKCHGWCSTRCAFLNVADPHASFLPVGRDQKKLCLGRQCC